jgi:hypothetical protein
MTTREEKLQELEKKVAKLEHEVERAEAIKACINVGNKYQTYHGKQTTDEAHLFALKTRGGAVEMLWGIYDEPEGILRWKRNEGYGKKPEPLPFTPGAGHPMTTPIIEVARDGKTAKGLWLMFSYYGDNWAAGQFAMDFIKENGEWKIWKYHTGGLIYSPFEKGWHVENREVLNSMIESDKKRPEGTRADRPPSYPWMWGPDEYFQNIPPIPLPYESYDDSVACIPPPGKNWELKKFE